MPEVDFYWNVISLLKALNPKSKLCIFRMLEFKIQLQKMNISDAFGSSNTWLLMKKHWYAANLFQLPYQSKELSNVSTSVKWLSEIIDLQLYAGGCLNPAFKFLLMSLAVEFCVFSNTPNNQCQDVKWELDVLPVSLLLVKWELTCFINKHWFKGDRFGNVK